VRLCSTLIKDDKGKLVEAMGIVTDLREDNGEKSVEERADDLKTANEQLKQEIVQHKHTEEKLRETGDYLDNLIDSSLDCIIIGDWHGIITRVNNSFLDLLGYTREEVVGKRSKIIRRREAGQLGKLLLE